MKNQRDRVSEEELHAYVDGSLVGERRDEVARLLEHNAELAARVSDYFALNRMFHERYDGVLGEPAPARLRTHVAAPRRGWKAAVAHWPQFAGMAAALILGVGIGVATNLGRQAAVPGAATQVSDSSVHLASFSGGEEFARQSAIAHVMYAPDLTRPVDAGGDREQDLVQWLSNRLGTSVHPPTLTRTGFELEGGRLLSGDAGPVAQFMYLDAKGERVTLCIAHRKARSDETAFKLYQDGPVNVFYWVDGDFGYAVSGGIDRKVLLDVSHDVYAQLTARADTVNPSAPASP